MLSLILAQDSMYTTTIWTSIEPCLGLVCACLPGIRSLFPSSHKASSSRQAAKNASPPKPGPKPFKARVGEFTQELHSLSKDDFESQEGTIDRSLAYSSVSEN